MKQTKPSESPVPEPLLHQLVVSLLDDQNGIPEASVGLLMEVISRINPNSESIQYLAEASIFRGRAFLPEDFFQDQAI